MLRSCAHTPPPAPTAPRVSYRRFLRHAWSVASDAPAKSVPITHAWSGYVAYTRETLPHVGGEDRVHHALGYCGSGVARASYGGYKAALRILGDRRGATPWSELALRPYPLHAFHPLGVMAAIGWKQLQDRSGR